VLPDGTYNKNTKVEYCCRNDGSAERPIKLPSSAPFYLYKLGDVCQEVLMSLIGCNIGFGQSVCLYPSVAYGLVS